MNRLSFVSLLVLAALLSTSACADSDEVPEPTTTDQLESCYELVYEVDLTNIGGTVDDAMEATFLVIDRMLLDLIPSGPWPPVFTDAMVEIQGEDRIRVRLTDVQDMGLVIGTIDQTPALDFRELTDESWELIQEQINQGQLVDYDSLTGEGIIEWKSSTGTDSSGREVHLTGRHVKGNARATTHPDSGQSHVVIEFRPDGVGLLSQIGGRLHAAADSPGKHPLAIFVDGQYLTSLTVNWEAPDSGITSGLASANEVATLINYSSLPAPVGHWDQGTFVSGPAEQNEC